MMASLLMLAVTGAILGCPSPAAQEASALAKKANAIRATADELKFRKLPWVTDLFEGFRLAREEKRPVFLYMITGDPLDDC